MTYTFRQIDDTYVVWLAPANRYMQLQAPAFWVLADWAHQLPESQIIRNCALQFKLQLDEARRFVLEVIGQLQSLISNYTDPKNVHSVDMEAAPLPDQVWVTTKIYSINGNTFRFRFNDPDLEEMIHPGFRYLEQQLSEVEADHCFDLFYSGDQAILQTEGQNTWKCPSSNPEQFIGLVFLQLLNCIHNCSDAHWMGAVHASAVSTGNGAVLFTAPSGSGKSTFAAMLMNQGYQVLSDDFSPVSLHQAQVYPFPDSISVKNRSIKVLQSYFPSLTQVGDSLNETVREVFLPLATGELPEPVKAIVFLQYNQEVEAEFKPISNLDAMDRFLQQLWLAPTTEAASHFMDWYFEIPCYTLQYSNTKEAINSLSHLFQP